MGNSASLESLTNGVEKDFSLRCTIHYTDGETQVETVQFNQDVTTWQFVSWAIAATKAYSSITLEAVYKNNANTVYFDGLQLFKEEFGTSYTYDKETGDLISVIDLQNKNTTYEYSNNDLTKIMQDDKVKMTYTYDDWHNVKTATTEEVDPRLRRQLHSLITASQNLTHLTVAISFSVRYYHQNFLEVPI